MDVLLNLADTYVLDALYAKLVPLAAFAQEANQTMAAAAPTWNTLVAKLPHPPLQPLLANASAAFAEPAAVSAWPRDYIPRQLLSLTALTLSGVHIIYFLFAYLSYRFVFNHEMMRHPRFLKNQVWLEIKSSLSAFPVMMLLTLPIFEAEVLGYSKLYDDPKEYGYPYLVGSAFFFLFFTDYCIYWIHRLEHHPAVYKYVHKPHHKWLIPTPFAAYAFHPLDGYLQSLPYHVFAFIFPLHRYLYLGLFVFVNLWTILIHDSDMITGHPLEKIINGPAHHTLHHLYFTVNYGQYFTWADRMGNSYKQPAKELDPMNEIVKAKHD